MNPESALTFGLNSSVGRPEVPWSKFAVVSVNLKLRNSNKSFACPLMQPTIVFRTV